MEIIVFLVMLSLFLLGLWLSIFIFKFNKLLGYVTTFLFPFIIGFMFGSVAIFYLTPVLAVSLGIYHIFICKR
ncbi:hypothetical protein H0266_15535 [Halobacillus locisalis]|uniref:Uncharacterized protein n=1 Tax=Halobacillus locisalis TaxID=220753 RepID=A0A838CWU4_9BACI|nr:hypothetical protein [Halobacillus locisalis]MBA2176309.1 hypothetical protein [Halobacillus locisalis]